MQELIEITDESDGHPTVTSIIETRDIDLIANNVIKTVVIVKK